MSNVRKPSKMRPIVSLGQDGCGGQAGAASGSPHQVLGTHSSDIPSSDVTNIKNTGDSFLKFKCGTANIMGNMVP